MKAREQLQILGIDYFCELVRKIKINLQGANLRNVDLQGANLRGANLQGVDLRGADLQYAYLRGANLRDVDLQNANLRGVDLQGADLQGADLRDAEFQGADLDFSCLPLWCGSSNIKIDARLAKQFLAHAFHLVQEFCQPTEEQKNFCNDFHRIKKNEFPRIE